MKSIITAAVLVFVASATFAQASAPEAAASATKKQKVAKRYMTYKPTHPASAATNPETTPEKKGGN